MQSLMCRHKGKREDERVEEVNGYGTGYTDTVLAHISAVASGHVYIPVWIQSTIKENYWSIAFLFLSIKELQN